MCTHALVPVPQGLSFQSMCWQWLFLWLWKMVRLFPYLWPPSLVLSPPPLLRTKQHLTSVYWSPVQKMLCWRDKGGHTWKKPWQWQAESKGTKWNIRYIDQTFPSLLRGSQKSMRKFIHLKRGARLQWQQYRGQDPSAHMQAEETPATPPKHTSDKLSPCDRCHFSTRQEDPRDQAGCCFHTGKLRYVRRYHLQKISRKPTGRPMFAFWTCTQLFLISEGPS